MGRWKLQPRANQDLNEHLLYLDAQRVGLGLQFLESIELTMRVVVDVPLAGQPMRMPSLTSLGLRTWRIRGFPNHVVVYRVSNERVLVVRVLHAALDFDVVQFDD